MQVGGWVTGVVVWLVRRIITYYSYLVSLCNIRMLLFGGIQICMVLSGYDQIYAIKVQLSLFIVIASDHRRQIVMDSGHEY